MKRGRGGSVTGGTGDIKPQILTMVSGTSTAGQYNVIQQNLPVPRFGTMKTKATVFEILSLEWYPQLSDIADPDSVYFGYFATQQLRSTGDTTTGATVGTDVADPVTFGAFAVQKDFTTSGATVLYYPVSLDLTDGNGNGILIATDRLFLHTANIGASTQGTTTVKVKYRLVNIGINEYVGIVQSQQG